MNFDAALGTGPYTTQYGTLLAPSGRVVAYVRATASNDDDANIANLRVPTLAAGLSKCTAGRNDVVVVLAGHTESITTATYLSATGVLKSGAQVIGQGQGDTRPTFTFSAIAAQWLVNQPNVLFHNLLLNFGGGAAVTIGIDVTAASVTFSNCEFITSVLSTSRANNVIRLSAGADDFLFIRNRMRGANAANGVVDNILVNATVARSRFIENQMSLGVTVATVGLIRFAAIATDCLVADNYLSSNLATSTVILDFDAAATGLAANNLCSIGLDSTPPAGFVLGTTGFKFLQNFVSGSVALSGYLSPAVDT